MTESRIPAPILVDDRPEFGPATLGDSLGLHAPVAAPSTPMASLPVPPLPPVVAVDDGRPETGIVAEAAERLSVEWRQASAAERDEPVDGSFDEGWEAPSVEAHEAHEGHDVWQFISRPGLTWCRDCQVRFVARDSVVGEYRYAGARIERLGQDR
jgi:hypothetical protein